MKALSSNICKMKKKTLKIIFYFIAIEILIFVNAYIVFYMFACNVTAPDNRTYCNVDSSTVNAVVCNNLLQNCLGARDVRDLRDIEDRFSNSSLLDLVKNGEIMVLDSGEEVNILHEDNTHNYLYIETFVGDSLWINKKYISFIGDN